MEMGALWASSSHGVSRARDQPVVLVSLLLCFVSFWVSIGAVLFSLAGWPRVPVLGPGIWIMSDKRSHDTTEWDFGLKSEEGGG